MVTEYLGIGEDTKYCYFQDTFIIFMKEKNSDNPYFALKVDNDDILEKKEETDEPKLIDNTVVGDTERYEKYMDGIEYKFFEDENYEYYYPSQKTEVVKVYFKNGEFMTAEQALKEGKITMMKRMNLHIVHIQETHLELRLRLHMPKTQMVIPL